MVPKAQDLTLSQTFHIAKVNLPAGTTVRLTYQLQNLWILDDAGKFLPLKDWNQNAHSLSSSVNSFHKQFLRVAPLYKCLGENDSHCFTEKHPEDPNMRFLFCNLSIFDHILEGSSNVGSPSHHGFQMVSILKWSSMT